MSKGKVLIVEDEQITRSFLSQLIVSLGFEADSCSNGEEAISKISTFQPDVILSDVLMPEYSGLQLLNYVQKKTPAKIPIVLISSMDASAMGDMVEDIGAIGFVSKPPKKEELLSLLEKAIASNV